VLERFVRHDGSFGRQSPLRVISDDGDRLLAWLPEGTEIIGAGLPDGRKVRDAPLAQRFLLPRVPVAGTWRGAGNLRLIVESWLSSVWWFFEPDGAFRCWYVNLELPRGRTRDTVDRIDGVLDVVVDADRTWRWKDEDEAEAALAAGRLTGAELAALRAEGERQIALAEAGAFPFDGTWCDFRPDPDWPAVRLPEGLAG
jgi:hypothetical protein